MLQASVSVKRLNKFLNHEELDPDNVFREYSEGNYSCSKSDPEIEIKKTYKQTKNLWNDAERYYQVITVFCQHISHNEEFSLQIEVFHSLKAFTGFAIDTIWYFIHVPEKLSRGWLTTWMSPIFFYQTELTKICYLVHSSL